MLITRISDDIARVSINNHFENIGVNDLIDCLREEGFDIICPVRNSKLWKVSLVFVSNSGDSSKDIIRDGEVIAPTKGLAILEALLSVGKEDFKDAEDVQVFSVEEIQEFSHHMVYDPWGAEPKISITEQPVFREEQQPKKDVIDEGSELELQDDREQIEVSVCNSVHPDPCVVCSKDSNNCNSEYDPDQDKIKAYCQGVGEDCRFCNKNPRNCDGLFEAENPFK